MCTEIDGLVSFSAAGSQDNASVESILAFTRGRALEEQQIAEEIASRCSDLMDPRKDSPAVEGMRGFLHMLYDIKERSTASLEGGRERATRAIKESLARGVLSKSLVEVPGQEKFFTLFRDVAEGLGVSFRGDSDRVRYLTGSGKGLETLVAREDLTSAIGIDATYYHLRFLRDELVEGFRRLAPTAKGPNVNLGIAPEAEGWNAVKGLEVDSLNGSSRDIVLTKNDLRFGKKVFEMKNGSLDPRASKQFVTNLVHLGEPKERPDWLDLLVVINKKATDPTLRYDAAVLLDRVIEATIRDNLDPNTGAGLISKDGALQPSNVEEILRVCEAVLQRDQLRKGITGSSFDPRKVDGITSYKSAVLRLFDPSAKLTTEQDDAKRYLENFQKLFVLGYPVERLTRPNG